MATKMGIFFFPKTSWTTTRNTIPIYLRVTISGQRLEVTTNRFVCPGQWSSSAGHVKGKSPEANEINSYLDYLVGQIYQYEREILSEGRTVTAFALRKRWFGRGEKSYTIMEAIGVHNTEMEALVGTDYKKSTLTKYKTTERHVQDFIKWRYKCVDLLLKDINMEFMKDLEYYLQCVKKLSINARGKMLKNVKKIIADCVDKDWLQRDPFYRFHVKHIDYDVPHLTAEEVLRIEGKELPVERLGCVRDIFLFSCYTGFAYIDAANLTREHLRVEADGQQWLVKSRQKTDILERVPLLPGAARIVEKYKNNPLVLRTGKLLPVPSNQKVNAYLKEIADLCEVRRKLTFHMARHTFATTITMDNGVPIESVSQMLGHKFIKTTQVYAKVTDGRIARDMEGVIKKYSYK